MEILSRLNRYKGNSDIKAVHETAINLLNNAGILKFLAELRRARIPSQGVNVHQTAAEAARASGYMDALEDIEYFAEKFIERQSTTTSLPPPRYGAKHRLISEGLYTEEELKG